MPCEFMGLVIKIFAFIQGMCLRMAGERLGFAHMKLTDFQIKPLLNRLT